MIKEISAYGHVDSDGRLSIYSNNEFKSSVKEYFKQTTIKLTLQERQYEFSDAQRSYYFSVVVRELQKAWLSIGHFKSLKDVDYEMRDKFLFTESLNQDTGEFEKELHTLKKRDTTVTKKMMREYLDRCIIFAATNLDWVIAFPNENLDAENGVFGMSDRQKNIKNISAKKSTF